MRRKAACAALEDALTMARSFGFIRVLADEGAQLLPVLERMDAQGGPQGRRLFRQGTGGNPELCQPGGRQDQPQERRGAAGRWIP